MIGRLHRETFAAMGTTCEVAVAAGRGDERRARQALAAARAEVETCESVLTRFDPGSDLSLLNARSGEWVAVDERVCGLLQSALHARSVTGGKFDPTILPALVALGYDRTFEELRPRPARRAPGWRAGGRIELDLDARAGRLARGVAVDSGGNGKGYSAARAIEAMLHTWAGLHGAFVDLGGDIAFHGAPPGVGPWRVAVADPRRPGRTLAVLGISSGAVATSGRDRRRFGPQGRHHHLIDPTTGDAAVAGPLAVTVVGGEAGEVEAFATALAISTLDESDALLAGRFGLSALVVPEVGTPAVIGDLPVIEGGPFASVAA
jgi:FAD:protein FMN transferase